MRSIKRNLLTFSILFLYSSCFHYISLLFSSFLFNSFPFSFHFFPILFSFRPLFFLLISFLSFPLLLYSFLFFLSILDVIYQINCHFLFLIFADYNNTKITTGLVESTDEFTDLTDLEQFISLTSLSFKIGNFFDEKL